MTRMRETGAAAMLAAGGTAGHLFPAFALAQELVRRGIGVDLVALLLEAVELRVVVRVLARSRGGDGRVLSRHRRHLVCADGAARRDRADLILLVLADRPVWRAAPIATSL